jgi:FkbM family methyltransferase
VLEERMKKDKSWRGFNIALGNQNETRDFVITKGAMCSSFLTPVREEIVRSVRRVNMRRLDDFITNLEDFPRNPSLFLKLDTQGFDLEVVNGAPRTLETTVGLQSEVSVCPIYHDMPHYLDSLKVYESLGFELIGLFEVTKARGRVMEYDCVLARR